MTAFSSLLKSVFDKLFFWRESFSNKAWALEKMKDVFIKELDLDPDQIEIKDFIVFLQGFYDNEDGRNLVQYPDFVMNTVSKMVTSTILSSINIQEKNLSLMFKLLRSAVVHGHLEKGQRVSMMFDCMEKLLVHANTLEHMMSYQFDASSALLFSVGGAQNYTRKSAGKYFIELVKFAFNKSDTDDDLLKKARVFLRDILTDLFCAFNKSLMQSVKALNSNCSLSIIANYCKILSCCASSCSEWGYAIAFNGEANECTFNVWCDLLRHLTLHRYCDIGDVAVLSVDQLANLVNQRRHTEEGFTAFETLSSVLVSDMASTESNVRVCDLIVMAHSIVSRCERSLQSSATRVLLLELSILPLLVVLGVPISSSDNLFHAIEVTKEELEKDSKKHSSILISCAMSNAFALTKDKEVLDASKFSSTIKYVTFKTMDAPENSSRLFLRHGLVSDRSALTCIISALKLFNGEIDDVTQELTIYEAENVQMYVAPTSNFSGISHNDLLTILECYRALLRRIGDCGTSCSKECLVSVLEALELHLVNVDPNLRDTAVKKLGQLYLLVHQDVLTHIAKILPSVWKCVRDKDENVVTQVFQFILRCVETRGTEHLGELLNHMQITQEELMTELQTNLLSRQWENVKAVAFSLYSSLAVSSNVIRYAEVCLQQSNSLAAPAVFSFIDKLLKGWTEWSAGDVGGCDNTGDGGLTLESRVEGLCNLLLEGWCDLLLTALNGDNTTCLRYAVDILGCLNEFLKRTDVGTICEKMKEIGDLERGGGVCSFDGLGLLKRLVTRYSKSVLKGSFFLESLGIDVKVSDKSMSGDAECVSDEREMIKTSETSQITELVDMEADINENSKEFCQSVERFDHTTELPPFTLSQKPFCFSFMISNALTRLAQEDPQNYSKIPHVLSGFKELLGQLPLKSMEEEVYRSTDEYDRSSLTILQDINQSLDSSCNIFCRKLEKELVQVFMIDILEYLTIVGREDSGKGIVEQGALTRLEHQIKHFSASKVLFSKFVLSQRRTVILGEVSTEIYEFGSEFFANGLAVFRDKITREISVKSYYSSSDGMKKLLDIYDFPHCVKISEMGPEKHNTDNGSLDASKKESVQSSVSESDVDIQSFISDSDLQKAIEGVRKSIDMDGNSTSPAATTMKKSTTVLMLELLQRVVETCKQCVTTSINRDTPLGISEVSMAAMYKALDELKEYEEACDDGFERDNDPTTIDCY